MPTSFRPSVRAVARALTVSLTLTLATAVAAPHAVAAGGPSVDLPSVPSVPVTEQARGQRDPDEASSRALRGNQSSSGGTQDGGGSFKATPLSPSGSWDVSQQTGDFSWSYPLRTPPSPGGFQPSLGLSYRSSTVDGRTSATNNQASSIGDGWDLGAGYVERTYGGCADDDEGGTKPPKVGDLCWRSDNATVSYPGGSGMLVKDDASGVWRQKADNGARIERFTGTANGDGDGERWEITTVDGTRYSFGSRPEAQSTWTVPVFGDDAGEPCHGDAFDTSSCDQAWRWNLDKVVDPHGNVILYSYEKETNSYGRNLKDAAVSYVRAGTLKSVEYGLRDDVAAPAPGRVDFALADRCVKDSDCTVDKKDNWPDTPLDERCVEATCKDHYSPSFWSTKRLAKITTKVWRGTAYADVDSWTLDQEFPATGDGEKAALWLKGITHTGHVGGSITLPAVTFEGTRMANRVEKVDGVGPLVRYRVTAIVSEAGGVTSIGYAKPDCSADALPANAESNTRRCFPVTWRKKDFVERTDYFHKYVVASVTSSDRFGANSEQQVSYEYLDGAAWHFSESEFTKEDTKTWDEFRGFGAVRVRSGRTTDVTGPVTLTEQRFYRGMDGDKQLGGGTRSVSVTDSEGVSRTDSDWLQGVPYESRTYLGDTAEVVSKSIDTPSWQGPTATRGAYRAYLVRTGSTTGYAALSTGGWRTTKTEKTYDDLGLLTAVNDLGDPAVASDDRCTTTTYGRNSAKWLMSYPLRQDTVSVHCGATPVFPDNALAGKRVAYDGQDFGAAPTAGSVTRQDVLDQRPASGPVYVTVGSATYDSYGRPLTVTNELGNRSEVGYTPATGGPLTQSVMTDAQGYRVTTTFEPAWGVATKSVDPNNRVTENAFDALGRTTETWLPNRKRATNPSGNVKLAYLVRNDAPTVVSQTVIGPNGNYATTNTLYDGLYRVRQVQAPTDGGRLLTDTRYDSHGRVHKSTRPYFNANPVDTKLVVAADNDVPGLTYARFDGAGRVVKSMFYGGGQKKWETLTAYDGDRVHVTPPQGGTPTTTITDARGQTTELRQYQASTPTGAFDATKYAYTAAGQLASATDPAGNTWRWTYDLQGHKVKSEDVDKGTSTSVYNPVGQLLSTTDGRGATLVNGYDTFGRKVEVRDGGSTGPVVQRFEYDTATGGKGKLASATRYVDGHAYVSRVDLYDQLYRPTQSSVVIPESEGALQGTYTTYLSYNPDGSVAGDSFAAAGGVPEETFSHTYDDLGRALTAYGGFGGTTTRFVTDTSYSRYGEVQRVQLGDTGKRTWLSYYYDDSTRRVARNIVDAEVPAPMQADVTYSYDDVGNIKSIADTPRDQIADVQCFDYDYLRRVTRAWTPPATPGCGASPTTGGPAPYWQSFTYDKAGNRLTEVDHASGGDTTRTSTYPQAGTPQAHAVRSVLSVGPSGTRTDEFGYDTAGNTTSRTVAGVGQQVAWDAEGRVAKVTEGPKVTSFVYSPDGTDRLLRKDPGGTTLYLGNQELRLAKGASAPTVTRYYAHGGRVVAMREGKTKITWLASDHQATARISIDASSMEVTRRRQLPFGGARGPVPASGSFAEMGFVGGTNDPSTGLVDIGARQYDQAQGRFLSVDAVMNLGDPQQWNAYAYSNNSPITYSDPSGLSYCDYNVCPGDPGYNPGGQRNNKDGGCVANCGKPHDNYTPGSDAPGGTSQGNTIVAFTPHVFVDKKDPIYPRLQEAWTKHADLIRGNTEWNSWQLICHAEHELCQGDFGLYFDFNITPDPQARFDLSTRLANEDGSISDGGIYLKTSAAAAGGIPLIRSLTNPESMVGATPEEVRAMLPEDWVAKAVKKGAGTRWMSQKDGRYGQIRYLSDGSPQVNDPLHQEPYYDVRIGGMQYRVAAAGSSVIQNPAIRSVQIDSVGPLGSMGVRPAPGEPPAAGGIG